MTIHTALGKIGTLTPNQLRHFIRECEGEIQARDRGHLYRLSQAMMRKKDCTKAKSRFEAELQLRSVGRFSD